MYMKILSLPTFSGGLAHLARALAWQARGDRFESGILHKKNPCNYARVFLCSNIPLMAMVVLPQCHSGDPVVHGQD